MSRIVVFVFALSCWFAKAAAPDATAIQIAAGGAHTCLLTAAGGVKCWGANSNAQLGGIAIGDQVRPFSVPGLSSGIAAITAGGRHTCALTTGGAVKCWGNNANGQLGNNSIVSSAAAVDVTGLQSGVIAVDAGYAHTCALLSGGGVKCWGRNANGAIGNGSTTDQLTPTDVTGLTSGVASISVGMEHSCAVTTSSGAKCWGYNNTAQIGDVSTTTRLTPTDVSGLTSGVAKVSAGNGFTCALTTTGGVKCWGSNLNGSIGANTSPLVEPVPLNVFGLDSGVVSISAAGKSFFFQSGGEGHACALMQTGALRCWGLSNYGQLGSGLTAYTNVPFDVLGLGNGVAAVSVGTYHSCALTVSGGVKCWGNNGSGRLGDQSLTDRSMPVNVFGFERQMPGISSGGTHACGVAEVGAVTCWGASDVGQTAGGSFVATKPTPSGFFLPPTGTNNGGATSIESGGEHTCAIDSNFTVLCWGRNTTGQLGNLSAISSANPVPVARFINSMAQYAYHDQNRAVAVSAGANHTCAIGPNGELRCWGRNDKGQLGNSNTFYQTSPAEPPIGFGFRQVSAGGQHTCAIDYRGWPYCWGYNLYGQLGDYTTSDSFSPRSVIGENARMIAAGSRHTCSITVQSGVQCWGANDLGQLGDGTNTQQPGPVTIFPPDSGVAAISASGDTTCALMVSGAIKCWGSNANGELGIGVVGGSRNVPTDVPQFASGGAVGVSVGTGFVIAQLPDSTSFAWGSGASGRLANNAVTGVFPLPVQTLGGFGNGNLRLAASDTYPSAFTLQSRFGVGRNEVVTSNPVAVSGISSPATVTITGGLISIDGGAYFAGPGSVANGGVVRVRVTASMNYDALSVATLNIGGQTASFQVRTRPNPTDAAVSPAVVLGENFTLILGSNGLVYGAGYNGTRQMGNGSTLNATAHAAVAGLTNIRRIAAGGNHALALRADGTVYAWGYNAAGQLGGAGAANSSGYPTQVSGLTNVVEIAAGQNHSLALKNDGTLWAWGLNAEGQLGTGNTASTATPVQVLTGVQSIAAGGRHTLAIKTNGTLWSWGANDAGQLGNGNTTPRATPAQVGSATNWFAVAAGSAFAMALRTDGSLYTWGANNKGQLGDGTTVNKNAPTLIASLTAIAAIAAGSEHSLALRVGGIAYSWGANDASQLGDGLTASRSTPFQIPNQGNLIAVAAGGAHSAALTRFGEVLVWGRNDDGQLGNRGAGTKGGTETTDTGKGKSENKRAQVQNVAPPSGSSLSIPSSSGTSVLVVKNLGYLSNDFGASTLGATSRSTYTYTNQSIAPYASFIGNLSVSVSGTDFSLANSTCPQTLLPGNACDFEVAFVPAAAGDRQGTLIVDSDITGSPQQFTLYGTGIGPATPSMTLGLNQLQFAPRPVGTNEVETFLIGNTGTAALNVSSISATQADFAASHNCTSVAPGATCTVTVTFTPSASGIRAATLTVSSNAGNQTVALNGVGINAIVDIDPAPFSFMALSGVTVATVQTSNTITVSGIDTVAPVSVTNGEFSVGCTGTFLTGTGSITNGQTICVRHTSATTISTATTTTLKIGGTSGQFTTTTANTPLYMLGVSKSGAGSGSVAAIAPAAPALNCGATCSANYNAGTVIELIAAPNAGSVIVSWTGCDAANGVRCTLTLNASRNVTATFATNAATVLGAPVIGTATAGNGLATIAYTAPASNGGSPITHYTATCNPGAVRAVSTTGGSAAPIIVTGLGNSVAYTCSVTASNAAGTSAASATVNVTPQSNTPFALIGVQSRRLHTGAGEFDLPIDTLPPITGNVSVEPRTGAAPHRIVFQFNGPVSQPGVASAVDPANMAIGDPPIARSQGHEVEVSLADIPDASRVKVTLTNVNGAGVDGQASVGFLVGDANGSGRVTGADIAGVKTRASANADGSNYKMDINANGVINGTDSSVVKGRAGGQLP